MPPDERGESREIGILKSLGASQLYVVNWVSLNYYWNIKQTQHYVIVSILLHLEMRFIQRAQSPVAGPPATMARVVTAVMATADCSAS